MKIDRITITGADDQTDAAELYDIEQRHPFVEWGILFSETRKGSPRYPSESKIKQFTDLGLTLSAHLCGSYSRQVMEDFDFRKLDELTSFSRVQINYNFSKSDKWQVKWIVDWAAEHPNKSIIFQANGANTRGVGMIEHVMRSPNIHFLYDSSGGRGLETAMVRPPFRSYTGYSGGLNPDNIEQFAYSVCESKNESTVWLDMESGARTENTFDLCKVDAILGSGYNFVTPASKYQ